jgi:predicted HicB family RNase H-like nuclease
MSKKLAPAQPKSIADLLPKSKTPDHPYALRVPEPIWNRIIWAAARSECSINEFLVAAATLAVEEVESGKGRV